MAGGTRREWVEEPRLMNIINICFLSVECGENRSVGRDISPG